MADANVPAPAPTRSDNQILPFAVWVPIGKRNYFTLDANLLREALEITPIDQAHPFVSPPSGDAIMDFVNELGYPEAHISSLQMLWGIITSTNADYVGLMWEEFVQATQTFLTDKANLGSPTKKGRKDKPHVIPYCRFTKLIICYLGRIHNIHQRSASLFHLAEEDLKLGNLKFVSKGKLDEHDQKVAVEKEGKKKTASAKQPKSKPATKKSSKPAPASKPKVTKEKPSKPSTAKPPKSKPAKENSTKATPLQKVGEGKVVKVHNVKSSFQLVDEPDEEPAQPEPETEPEIEYRGESEEYDVERAIQMSLESFQAHGHAHAGGMAISKPRRTPATEEASTGPSAQPQDDTSANIVRDSPFLVDAETSADTDRTNSREDKTAEINEGQAGSDPGNTPESRPLPDDNKMDED
ncbi:hypothetical protein Tco_0856094 [Tanacetum coccineum]